MQSGPTQSDWKPQCGRPGTGRFHTAKTAAPPHRERAANVQCRSRWAAAPAVAMPTLPPMVGVTAIWASEEMARVGPPYPKSLRSHRSAQSTHCHHIFLFIQSSLSR